MRLFRTTGIAAGLIAAGTLIGASLSTFASVFDWSTTPATNATADPNCNWSEGMLPSTVNDSARCNMAAIAAYVKDITNLTGGSGNAYTLTLTQPMQAWSPGLFGLVVNRTNTGPATLSVNGLTPKPMRFGSGNELVTGQLLTTVLYLATYVPRTDEVILIGLALLSPSNFLPFSANSTLANLTGSAAPPTNVSLAALFAAAPAGSIQTSALAQTGLPGEVRWFQASSCPTGWVIADGTAGGAPDLRGAFIRGLDNGKGLDPGRTLASFQGDLFASHSHGVIDPGHAHSLKTALAAATGGGQQVPNVATGSNVGAATDGALTGISLAANGGSETRPKNVALLPCYHG